jgi:cytochrome c oxidase assembly factor CtaG/polyferredoxin
MDSALETYLTSWPFDPWLVASLLATAGIYLRGWLALRRRLFSRWDWRQLAAFTGGLGMIFLALGSPIEIYAPFLLQVHMAQHLLLMMVAPPLLWLGEPLIPLLRGLPAPVRTYWVAPVFRSALIRRIFGRLTWPGAALVLFTATSWLWHWPPLYELALRSDRWHYVQHVCFLLAGLLFWYPVVRPFPARPRWSSWLLLPFLILADVQNTVLSALLTFSNHVLYPYYEEVPRLNGLSALSDQAAAGVLMWVPGSVAYLVPLFAIGVGILFGTANSSRRPVRELSRAVRPVNGRLALPLVSRPRRRNASVFDLLRVPLVGAFLQWRLTRRVVQTLMLLVAVAVVVDGLTGPQVGAMNLAGVLPWVHWRGFLILGLLSAGNVFCYACPFTLPRTLAGRWLTPRREWPRPLRSKWLAVGLLVVFLWAYEAFALWDSPWWTAWIAIGYFAGAFAVDTIFRSGTFCKYVCPVGQFNFVQSLVSPLEVKVRDASTCAACRTRDCIQGRDGSPGCATGLFQPRKAGNLDCTFCLDCVRACPYDNVGVLAVTPGAELWRDTFRSGIGRLARRTDIAALALVLVFGAFANAAGMVAPVVQWLDGLSSWLGQATPLLAITAFFFVALGVAPLLTVGLAALASRRWGRLPEPVRAVANRFAFALIPLGFAMWLAHYCFHLLTGYDAVIPAAQRFAGDWGWPGANDPNWIYACCRPVPAWLFRAEIVCLDIGLLLSLYAGHRLARDQSPRPLRALAPWALLMVFLFAAGVWIVLQPMQMRGTLPAGR